MTVESIPNAMAFFARSAGRWRSQRTSHHLLHRRTEAGASHIEVVTLPPEDDRLAAIARLHGEPAETVQGGCHVRWLGSMAWDRAGEDHQGETVFALIPTDEHGRQGKLLRDRGYAETATVAGRFRMDDEDGLELTTTYETMHSREHFRFVSSRVRLRTSTVEGLSNTASLSVETRIEGSSGLELAPGPLPDMALRQAGLGW
ncbi:phycobiliprotein lyase [Candidatus Synechococcus spongiarum]|uniref:Chromophore lyase CpcS/CpeS n=1 Tax=Candidatus Synechococcus spongiarum LMB bulk15N TaxID=1943583 RepID=A0A1T1CRP2_9SYNE|nr:phycobiliprotein lyase [Candidatus Synechococcus spongiarum]OOV31275.1 phycobiliprotein lyase [Candidatus Synechococcus spongiarum LMB bulk15N]